MFANVVLQENVKISWHSNRINDELFEEMNERPRILVDIGNFGFFPLFTNILEGSVDRKRVPGRQRRMWTDDNKEWFNVK